MCLLCSDPLPGNETLADFLKREKERIKVLELVVVITIMMVVEGKRQRFTRKCGVLVALRIDAVLEDMVELIITVV